MVQRGLPATKCLLQTMASACSRAVRIAVDWRTAGLLGCAPTRWPTLGEPLAPSCLFAAAQRAACNTCPPHATRTCRPLLCAGADVGPEERASSAGSPYACEGEKTAAGGLGENCSCWVVVALSDADMAWF